MANVKYVNFRFFSNFSTFSDIWYLRVFGALIMNLVSDF